MIKLTDEQSKMIIAAGRATIELYMSVLDESFGNLTDGERLSLFLASQMSNISFVVAEGLCIESTLGDSDPAIFDFKLSIYNCVVLEAERMRDDFISKNKVDN